MSFSRSEKNLVEAERLFKEGEIEKCIRLYNSSIEDSNLDMVVNKGKCDIVSNGYTLERAHHWLTFSNACFIWALEYNKKYHTYIEEYEKYCEHCKNLNVVPVESRIASAWSPQDYIVISIYFYNNADRILEHLYKTLDLYRENSIINMETMTKKEKAVEENKLEDIMNAISKVSSAIDRYDAQSIKIMAARYVLSGCSKKVLYRFFCSLCTVLKKYIVNKIKNANKNLNSIVVHDNLADYAQKEKYKLNSDYVSGCCKSAIDQELSEIEDDEEIQIPNLTPMEVVDSISTYKIPLANENSNNDNEDDEEEEEEGEECGDEEVGEIEDVCEEDDIDNESFKTEKGYYVEHCFGKYTEQDFANFIRASFHNPNSIEIYKIIYMVLCSNYKYVPEVANSFMKALYFNVKKMLFNSIIEASKDEKLPKLKGCLEKISPASIYRQIFKKKQAKEEENSNNLEKENDHITELDFVPGSDLFIDYYTYFNEYFGTSKHPIIEKEYMPRNSKVEMENIYNIVLTFLILFPNREYADELHNSDDFFMYDEKDDDIEINEEISEEDYENENDIDVNDLAQIEEKKDEENEKKVSKKNLFKEIWGKIASFKLKKEKKEEVPIVVESEQEEIKQKVEESSPSVSPKQENENIEISEEKEEINSEEKLEEKEKIELPEDFSVKDIEVAPEENGSMEEKMEEVHDEQKKEEPVPLTKKQLKELEEAELEDNVLKMTNRIIESIYFEPLVNEESKEEDAEIENNEEKIEEDKQENIIEEKSEDEKNEQKDLSKSWFQRMFTRSQLKVENNSNKEEETNNDALPLTTRLEENDNEQVVENEDCCRDGVCHFPGSGESESEPLEAEAL